MRSLARALAALALVLVSVGVAAPAIADEADCAPTYLATDGRELFALEDRFVPPALRAFPPDCASRIAGEDFDDGQGISTPYELLYTDTGLDQYTAILRAFVREGWIDDTITSTVDTGDGQVRNDVTLGELEALTVDPVLVRSRFGDQQTSTDTIEMTYSSSGLIDPALTTPSIVITVLTSRTFGTTGIADPSVLSGLPTIADAAPTPVQAGVIAGGAVMLMLVVGWPSSLLNSVVGSRYDSLVRWWQRGRAPTTSEKPRSRRRLPGWLMWPGFALAAILGAFVDPDFGWNPMSARVVGTLFVSFLLFNLATWQIVRRVARRIQPDSQPLLRFRWGSLALVALAVVISRLLELEPGIIYGLVAGVAYATALRASGSAVVALVGSGLGLALALVAWVGYSALAPVVAGAPGSVPLIIGLEFLAAVTVKGVSSLPLALLPLGTLDGAKVAKWRRGVWAAAYAIGLAAFMLVLVTIPKSWGAIPGDFVRWLVLFGLYALAAVIIWAANAALLRKRPAKETPIGDQPDAITID